MTNVQYEKIRVLLIDDRPRRLEGRAGPEITLSVTDSDVVSDFSEYFDLKWIANALEAREYIDRSRLLSADSPEELNSLGVIPEIVCFDYALTGDVRGVAERRLDPVIVERLSPIPVLRSATQHTSSPNASPPPWDDGEDDDSQGCFVGGLTVSLFQDHVCVPVALTRKSTEWSEETKFFEWMLEGAYVGVFDRKGDMLSWSEILKVGIPDLRARILHQINAGLARPSLRNLIILLDPLKADFLEVVTRYGRRKLPIAGLFLDLPVNSQDDAVGDYVRKLYNASVGMKDPSTTSDDQGLAALKMATAYADKAMDRYSDDELMESRFTLSELTAIRDGEGELSQNDEELLSELESKFMVQSSKKGLHPSKSCDLRELDGCHLAMRWAALFVTVRLVALRAEASQVWRSANPGGGVERFGEDLSPSIDEDDAFLAAFPLARVPIVLPWHKGSKSASASGTWTGYLTTLNSTNRPKNEIKSGPGNLGLSFRDVLAGREWLVEEGKVVSLGFKPGERALLRMYCEDFGIGIGGIEQLRTIVGDIESSMGR